MKRYFCDRCKTQLNKATKILPHYDMRDSSWSKLSHKNEKFVCEPCVKADPRFETHRLKQLANL